jgi:Spy/CpxP family protein refolding chaperone
MQMPYSSYKRLRSRCGGILLLLALQLPILLPSMPALSQAPASSPERPTERRHTRPSMDDRVRRLAQALDLDEAQRAAVKKILEQRQQQTLRIRHDPSISGSARISHFRALQDSTVERIRAVLNEEQRKKYDPLAVRRTEPAPEQRSVEDWLKATTPQ